MEYEILHQFPEPQTESVWRDLLGRVELPAHYNAPEFFREPHWTGRRPFAVLAKDGAAAVGVLTGLHSREQLISGLPSRPQIAIDSNAQAALVLRSLMEGVLQEGEKSQLVTVHAWKGLELTPFTERGFQRRELLGSVVLDLTLGAEALFQQFPKDRRRNIRFAEKNGIRVRLGESPEDFSRAYEVYSAWYEAQQGQAKGERRSFEHFVKTQSLFTNRRLFLAEHEGKVVAVNMFRFYPGGLFESAANYSLAEFLHLKPNDLLQWRGIEWACSQGLRRHSLGGAHPFLARFGGTVVPIVRYRLDRTLLRRHDLRESVSEMARKKLGQMPSAVQDKVRQALGKKASGKTSRKPAPGKASAAAEAGADGVKPIAKDLP